MFKTRTDAFIKTSCLEVLVQEELQVGTIPTKTYLTTIFNIFFQSGFSVAVVCQLPVAHSLLFGTFLQTRSKFTFTRLPYSSHLATDEVLETNVSFCIEYKSSSIGLRLRNGVFVVRQDYFRVKYQSNKLVLNLVRPAVLYEKLSGMWSKYTI